MLKRTRMSRLGGPMIWALAVVVIAPAAAEAQQGGLFPLQSIKRKRTPCEMEDPLYRMYRHEFYGYHPTCWRKFPANWGCPSPEAPDLAKAFDETQGGRKLDTPKPLPDDEGDGAPGPDGGMRGGNRPNPNALPPLPSGDSLFDTGKPNAGGGRMTPPTDPPGTPPATDPGTPDGAVPPRPTPPGTTPGGDDREQPPGLTLPDPTTPTASVTNPTSSAAESNAAGFQPAKRRGLLSQLFSGQRFRR